MTEDDNGTDKVSPRDQLTQGYKMTFDQSDPQLRCLPQFSQDLPGGGFAVNSFQGQVISSDVTYPRYGCTRGFGNKVVLQ